MDFSQFRLNTLFNPAQMKKQFMNRGPIPVDNGQLDYQPKTEANDMFMDALRNMPQREEPGAFQKIASVIASMGSSRPTGVVNGSPIGFEYNPEVGHAASERALYPNYDRGMTDWRNKIEPLNKAADNENQYNTNQRILSNDQRSRQLQERTIARQETKDIATDQNADEKRKLDERRVNIAEKRADAYALKSERPNLKYFTDKDGMVKAYDPDGNTVTDLGIDTKDLNDTDKLRMQLHNSLEEIHARGNETRITKETTPAVNPNVSKPKPPTSAANNRDLLNRAQQLYNTRTDLQPYLILGNDGKPNGQIKPATKGFAGYGAGDKTKEQEARDLLYPKQTTPVQSNAVSNKNNDPLGIR